MFTQCFILLIILIFAFVVCNLSHFGISLIHSATLSLHENWVLNNVYIIYWFFFTPKEGLNVTLPFYKSSSLLFSYHIVYLHVNPVYNEHPAYCLLRLIIPFHSSSNFVLSHVPSGFLQHRDFKYPRGTIMFTENAYVCSPFLCLHFLLA